MATEFDAESVKNRITERLKSKVAWQDILYFSTNNRIIDAVSEEIAYLASYDSYLTRESKWSLARNTSSLVAQTPLHRYDVHRKQSSTGTLRVCLNEDCANTQTWDSTIEYQVDDLIGYNNKIYKALQINTNKQPDVEPTYWQREDSSIVLNIDIPRFTLFSDGGDITVTNLQATQLLAGDDYVDVDVIQGIPREYNNTATGVNNETFSISVADIENSFTEGYVNDVEWNQVTSLFLSEKDAYDFEIENFIDFTGIYFKFGDNLFGKKLTSGDTVKLLYLESLGVNGNILSTNIINSVDSTVFNTLGDSVDIFCSNITSLLGGTEIEDKESIRVNAPNTFQTGDRASTAQDYETIISNNFSYIEKIVVWGVYETNIDQGLYPWSYIPTEENKVQISALTNVLGDLSESQKTEISAEINQFKAPTDILNFVDAEIAYIVFNVDAKVTDTSFTLVDVRSNINTALYDRYSAFNREFFQHIRFSDYQAYIDGVAGVDWHDTSIDFFTLLTFDGAYDKITTLPLINLTVTTVKIYITDIVSDPNNEFLVGTDNGAGIFIPEAGFDLTGSTIDYSTGDLTIDVVSGLTAPAEDYQIRVAYLINDKDAVLTARNQIFNYSEEYTTINVEYA